VHDVDLVRVPLADGAQRRGEHLLGAVQQSKLVRELHRLSLLGR
jgi:hypothetical protein